MSNQSVIENPTSKIRQAVTDVVKVWEELRMKSDKYSGPSEVDYLFSNLGRQLLEFSLWTGSVRDNALRQAERIMLRSV